MLNQAIHNAVRSILVEILKDKNYDFKTESPVKSGNFMVNI